jgi:hypothetical protein
MSLLAKNVICIFISLLGEDSYWHFFHVPSPSCPDGRLQTRHCTAVEYDEQAGPVNCTFLKAKMGGLLITLFI